MGAVLGFAAGVVVTIGAALFGARAAPVLGLVVVLVPTVTVAAITTFPGAMAAGGQCWACWDGFLVNGLGSLTADHGGWQGLVLFLGCAAAANLAGVTWRHLRAAPAPNPSVVTGHPGTSGPAEPGVPCGQVLPGRTGSAPVDRSADGSG